MARARAIAYLVAAVCLLSSTSALAQQPPRDRTQLATGTARIRGRVVALEDSRSIRRAIVRLSAPELREPRSAATDADGRYEFIDLPAGRFMVTATKAGFVAITHGQTRPGEMGRPIEIRDRQTIERIDFALPRGAAITGRVVDEYGEPVANASVQPVQLRFVNGERQPSMAGSGSFDTPDTGEFRLWGLAPGEYLVNARMNNVGFPGDADDRTAYAATYYPGVTSAPAAQPIKLDIGQTVSGIEIMLQPTRGFRISGTAVDSRGQLLRSGYVNAMQRSQSMIMGSTRSAQIGADGTFTISGVTPGTYQVRGNAPPSPGGGPPETVFAIVTVTGDDVSGVVLMPMQPVTVTGRIEFDPPVHSLQPAQLSVMAIPKSPMLMMPMGPTGPPIVHDNFSFELKASPGDVTIRAMARSTAWMLKSVMIDGKDVTDDSIELVSGRDLDDVTIVMTNRIPSISGLVTSARGEIAANASVFVFAQDRERWFGSTRYVGSTRPDQNGRYTLRMLPPGDYYAVAVEYFDGNRRGDPAYLEELAENALRFTLVEAETKTLDLKISASR